MTLPPASRERAFLTASHPADFMKKASVNSVKLIRAIVPDTVRAWQCRSPALTRVRGSAVTASRVQLFGEISISEPTALSQLKARIEQLRGAMGHIAGTPVVFPKQVRRPRQIAPSAERDG